MRTYSAMIPAVGLLLTLAVPGTPFSSTQDSRPAPPSVSSALTTTPLLPDSSAPTDPAHVSPGVAVTLLTGDQVVVSALGDDHQAVEVVPADRGGRTPSFVTLELDGELYVIPEDVHALIPDTLDPALFNVSQLLEYGYDDASTDTLPLIVRHQDASSSALPGATATLHLESIQSTGMALQKGRAGQLRAALTELAQSNTDHRSTGALAGIDKIWLDGKIEANLDESVAQIGAPYAWDAGFDGSGMTVAVLDSGIDTDHPDFDGTVVLEYDFSGNSDPHDNHGHGTHVASIVGGSGAASDGQYTGVAPGIEFFNGKVLGDFGNGQISWAVDGMEWAVENGADIVNLSLGTRDAAGVVMDEAIEHLSAEHGTLFVVAAGNDGCAGCVSYPATADSALSVGSVTKDDEFSDRSSGGPIPGTSAVKPDVTGPGVDIIAARAWGTFRGVPINDYYTSISGTSMAAPHVAGAAALLWQANPELTGQEMKSLLMNTAQPHPDWSVYWQGAGRIDVEQALDANVIAEPGTVNFGYYEWPHDEREPEAHTVTYRNLSDQDVELDLSVDVWTATDVRPPEGTLTVSSPTVTVPAEGTASVDVVLDSAAGVPGLFGGYLLGTSADGAVVRTPVGVHLERELVELRLTGVARDGRPAAGMATIFSVEDGDVAAQRRIDGAATPCTEDSWSQSSCILVPPGTYAVTALVDTMPDFDQPQGSARPLHKSLVGHPEIEIDADTEIVLDARLATEVLIDTPEHETKANVGGAMFLGSHRVAANGAQSNLGISLFAGAVMEERLFMQPAEDVSTGSLTAFSRWRLEAPQITLEVTAPTEQTLEPQYYPLANFSDVSEQFPMLDGELDTQIVDVGTGTPAEVALADVEGNVALALRSDAISVAQQTNNAAAAGAVLVIVANDTPGVNSQAGQLGVLLDAPVARISGEEGEELRALLDAGPVSVHAHGVRATPFSYELMLTEEGGIRSELEYEVRTEDLATVRSALHTQASDHISASSVWYPYLSWQTSSFSQQVPAGPAPRVMETYLTADQVQWSHSVGAPERPYGFRWPGDPMEYLQFTSGLESYEAGETTTRSWFEQPLAPGPRPSAPPTRTGDTVRIEMGMLDSAGNYAGVGTASFQNGFDTSFRVFRGEELVVETAWNPALSFPVEAEPTNYRVEFDVDNRATWAHLSTQTSGVWTFTTERPVDGSSRIEPLITLDYDLDVNLRNTQPVPNMGEGANEVVLQFGHPAGSEQFAIEEATLEVSYNDGKRWEPVTGLSSSGENRFTATVDVPLNRSRSLVGDAVSLRVTASDSAGNTLEQEILRAYGIEYVNP